MPIGTSYTAEFRRRIQDVRASRRAMGFGVTDAKASSAIAEVTNGHFIVTVIGGTAISVDLDLTDSRYDTIGSLYNALARVTGYRASKDEDVNQDHPSVDLEPFGPTPVGLNTGGVELRHHIFSDGELEEIIRDAVRRHNPSLTPLTLPQQEWSFVLPLAHAQICRVQAYDASKRKGLDRDVSVLQGLAESYERQYKDDTARLARAIQSPKEANSNVIDEGDVVLGKNFRRSLRTGFMAPLAATISPAAVVLLDPEDGDVEDDNVLVNWQRNKELDFYSYELWMDATPEVVRRTEDENWRGGADRQTTSIRVFQSFGSDSNAQKSSFATFAREFGQLIRAFSVGDLESDTEYYFRLFVTNLNYATQGSNVVQARTKPLRARFATGGSALSANTGAAGAMFTVQLDTTKGAFTVDHKFRVGEKEVIPAISGGGYTLTIVVPAFQNLGQKDLSLLSPTGLLDVAKSAFTVVAA